MFFLVNSTNTSKFSRLRRASVFTTPTSVPLYNRGAFFNREITKPLRSALNAAEGGEIFGPLKSSPPQMGGIEVIWGGRPPHDGGAGPPIGPPHIQNNFDNTEVNCM